MVPVYKQLDSAWYPSVSYSMSVTIISMCIAVVSNIIFVSEVYWMSGFLDDIGRFFFFCFAIYLCDITIGAMFRTISYSVANQFVAQQMYVSYCHNTRAGWHNAHARDTAYSSL